MVVEEGSNDVVVPAERSLVFNIVWTGTVFTYLRWFVASQLAESEARFRFVVNGCPPEQVAAMEEFAAAYPDRVVEVLETSPKMLAHGVALDAVRACRDDGEHFCFIDPDILAQGPFLRPFLEALATTCDGVTSGRGVWRDDDLVPPGHPGVSGEYFYSQDGYLFGSPHFAMYRRAPLDETCARWGVGLGSAGPDCSDETRARLVAAGHEYLIYDTGKIVNILFQEDGNVLDHFEHPELMHIGGLSHYLSPTKMVKGEGSDELEPDWRRWRGMASRFEVAHFTATVLKDLCAGESPPEVPPGLEPSMSERLGRVREALVTIFERHGPHART